MTDYLNQKALANGQAAMAQRNNVMNSADNSNAYYNRLRDPAYVERYDTSTRRRREDEISRSSSTRTQSSATAAANKQADRPFRPLVDFFDHSGLFVWPADAPTDGDLSAKQAISNSAAKQVFVEFNEKGNARIATVTAARTKLLDYGRPALDQLRNRTTPAVAELFHAFLLSLYDSLERASSSPTG